MAACDLRSYQYMTSLPLVDVEPMELKGESLSLSSEVDLAGAIGNSMHESVGSVLHHPGSNPGLRTISERKINDFQ